MFRLLKLAAYALFGYAIYEFFRGMNAQSGGMGGGQAMSGSGRRSGGSSRPMRGADRDEGQISGPGEGRAESTLDADGGSVRRRVGRGAVSSGM